MQRGLGGLAAAAATLHRYYRHAAVLLLGLAAGGCVGTGQIANLADGRRTTVAFETIDGAPPAVFHKFVSSLKDEAGARQIQVVSSNEANYRLRGYLAVHGADSGTAIAWVLDVYDANERRAFRLSGEEKTAARSLATADDQVLARIARAGMQQFATFAATADAPSPTAAAAPQRSAAFGWLDDWAPEASGIFRILRREPARPEIAADAGTPLPPDEVPLPKSRPAPAGVTPSSTFAFAPDDR